MNYTTLTYRQLEIFTYLNRTGAVLQQVDCGNYSFGGVGRFNAFDIAALADVKVLVPTSKKADCITFTTKTVKEERDTLRSQIYWLYGKLSLSDEQFQDAKDEFLVNGSFLTAPVSDLLMLHAELSDRLEQHEQNLQAISEPTVFEHNGIMIDSSRASDVDARNLLEY